MKKLILLCSFAVVSIVNFSCSSNKSIYEPTTEVVTGDFKSGYFDKNVNGNEYEVVYRGLNMNATKTFDLSMLRAAEIAKNKNFKNFVVLSKVSESNQVNKKKIQTSLLKVALYNEVPAKYQTYYNASEEYDRLSKKYRIN